MRNKPKSHKDALADPCEKCGIPLGLSATKSTRTGHVHYPRCPKPAPVPELFMRLQDFEDYAAAGCGCILQRSPVEDMNACPEFLQCPLHAAAPKLLKELKINHREYMEVLAEEENFPKHDFKNPGGCPTCQLIAAAERKA